MSNNYRELRTEGAVSACTPVYALPYTTRGLGCAVFIPQMGLKCVY